MAINNNFAALSKQLDKLKYKVERHLRRRNDKFLEAQGE
jgi:ribosome-associated translation inhibitor RaiA